MKNSFLSFCYIIIALASIFACHSVNISPTVHWIYFLSPYFIPLFIILNLFFLALWILKKRWIWVGLSLIVLWTGYPFYFRTIAWNKSSDNKSDLRLLSYNVRVFNNYSHLNKEGKSAKIIRFSSEYDADIKCFQEFYNYPGSASLSTVKELKKSTPYYFFKPVQVVYGQEFGLAVFSRFPIVKTGEIVFPHKTLNQAIFVDIAVGKDTIRVFNIHLQSMSIDDEKLPEFSNESENRNRFRKLYQKLKRGAEYRSMQIEALVTEIKRSPHKVIVAGDINDTPYSYSYEKLSEVLLNAFEKKGRGLGFTYNGKLFFLRIDNIFYDENLNLNYFEVRKDILFSDHFPLVAGFETGTE